MILGTRKKRIVPLSHISRKGAEAQRKGTGKLAEEPLSAPLRVFWGNAFFLSPLKAVRASKTSEGLLRKPLRSFCPQTSEVSQKAFPFHYPFLILHP
ncbi:MAG: hypothetical protein DRI57_31225 [Deltaproteobacteria bacterium]|nr:MAG: hypothetical protein DRI57_31225 [Deltaproteobacteria bacterium]